MIYICTALYLEAEPFIHRLHLKKNLKIHAFEVFQNEKWTLMITGTGKMKAAIAVTYVLGHFSITKQDLLLNVGICGARESKMPLGTCCLIHQLIDHGTGHTYYPDLLFKHPFKESNLETFEQCQLIGQEGKMSGELIDQEATGIYEAAILWMESWQLAFIKVVSDHLKPEEVTPKQVKDLMTSVACKVIEWADTLSESFEEEQALLTPEEESLLAATALHLKCSETMSHTLCQIARYRKSLHEEIRPWLETLQQTPCGSKKEGKMLLERIQYQLI